MSQSTDGQICFGISFPEGFEFPWDKADCWQENWWRNINNYKPLFDLHDNASDEDCKKYYEHRRAFDEQNPFPVTLINTCSGDYPMYILAIPTTCLTASRGYPKIFDPKSLTIEQKDIDGLLHFITKYIKFEDECEIDLNPKWYLSSYWG